MDVVGTTGWLAALAARPDGGSPLPAEEALGLVSALARRLAEEHTAGTVHGSVLPAALQAPEVLAGGEPGPVSDVYALTAGLWTLLTGRPPHVAEGEDDVAPAVLAARRSRVPDDVPGLPAPVTALLRRGLATDPADRPQDAAELAAALDDCAGLVDYTRRRELGQRYRPRPVTPRLAPDGVLAAPGGDAPVGPVTPVDPLPVVAGPRRVRRIALVVAALAVAGGVALLLVPGLDGEVTGPRTTPRPGSSFDVGPAGGASPGPATAGTSGAPAPAGTGGTAGTGPAPAGTSGGPVPDGPSGTPARPGTTSGPVRTPGTSPTSSSGTTSTSVPPVSPPPRTVPVTVPPATDPNVPPLPTA